MAFSVYILTDEDNSRFSIGFTNNLVKKIHEVKHQESGRLASQQVNKLVYFETHDIYEDAKRREREILGWEESYTRTVISLMNPRFNDLYKKIFQ
jgi:predicted GIY-YIG superfamily endonuclease